MSELNNIFSDEEVYLGSDNDLSESIKYNAPMDTSMDTILDTSNGLKKKKKKKKKKKRKSDKDKDRERRDTSFDPFSPSPEPLGSDELREPAKDHPPPPSSSLPSPEAPPKRKLPSKDPGHDSKRSKVQIQLVTPNHEGEKKSTLFKKKTSENIVSKANLFSDSPEEASESKQGEPSKKTEKHLLGKSTPSKEQRSKQFYSPKEVKREAGYETTRPNNKRVGPVETSKSSYKTENTQKTFSKLESDKNTRTNNSEQVTLSTQAKSSFSNHTKLEKVLAADVKKAPSLQHKLSKEKTSPDSATPEVDGETIEDSSIPRHLPPKHKEAANAPFPWINMYPDRPNPKPGVQIQVNGSKYFTAPEFTVYSDCLTVKNDGNYRVSMANYGVATGTYYYEIKVRKLPKDSNIRVGVAQINVAKQAPLGFDGFGYAFRNSPPTLFHRSRPYDANLSAREGDVIGVLLHLPPLAEPEQREINFRVWDKKYVYAQFSYEQNPLLPSILKPIEVPCGEGGRMLASPVPQPEQLPYSFPDPHRRFDQLPLQSGSQLVYFINGKQAGLPFSNLILAKYYPAVSIYRGAKLEFNFGPEFRYPPPPVWYPRIPTQSGSVGFYPVSQHVQPFSSLVTSYSPFES